MSGAISQAESNILYKRIIRLAIMMRDLNRAVEDIKSENVTFNFGATLDEPTIGQGSLTKADLLAFTTGPLFDYADFYSNVASVPSDGVADSSDRVDKINPLLLAEPLF